MIHRHKTLTYSSNSLASLLLIALVEGGEGGRQHPLARGTIGCH